MPSKQKIVATHTFDGGMNSDTSEFLLPSNMYRDAINIRVLSTAGGNKGILTNCKGNVQIEYDLPSGNNVTLGRYPDEEKNKFYWLNYNSEGFHAVYMYDGLLNSVTTVILNLTDTAGVDIFQFTERGLILHIDIIRSPSGQDMMYFAQEQFKPKKFNIQKALDKSPTGYGMVITAEDINAYKLASIFPPSLTYFTDTTRATNYLYTSLFKASVRHIYDDGERNNWSEFSTVPLPQNESYSGNASVSNVNNGLQITVETGSSIVKRIEIAIQISSDPFVSVITLDKALLGIADNTTYDYLWYNDNSSYSALDQLNVYRAYSFLPKLAALQAFTKNSLVYGKGKEGWEALDIDVSVEVQYTPLFLPSDTENTLNDPFFQATLLDYDYTKEGKGRRRNSLIRIVVGHDVKSGNFFELFGRNGQSGNYYFSYLANNADSAVTVANQFKQKLVATGNVMADSEELPPTDIWTNTIDGLGNVTFEFIWRGQFNENATQFEGRVNPISTATLKDAAQSTLTQKSGGSVKYAIIYWDEDTRRSNAYTEDSCFVRNDFVTQTNGFKKIVHEVTIMNRPPVWAKYWELVRTKDLTYGNDFIQILIQEAIESQSTTNTEYVDLVIGSLYTYQRMYPNTVIAYEFEKNDRVRLMKKENSGTYYAFLETVVLAFFPVGTTETINQDVTTNQSAVVTIGGTTNTDNIGRYIVINDVERQIIAVPSASTYALDSPYGTLENDDEQKYPDFKIIDKRGIIRVRKPIDITIEDNSLIEVYKPTQNVESAEKQFYLFGQKYAITDWGTDLRAHTGNVQNQDPLNPVSVPAIVDISKGTTYVRNRQLPTNNQIPGTQVVIDLIEDAQYSDFYVSGLNDNGKIAPEDDASGEKRFGSRLRFSNNYIEGTNTNGLNDFDNINREDYNDPYGDFMLLKFREGFLYGFKQLRTLYIPILTNIIVDENNQQLLGTSDKLLNKAQYFAWEGGIGNNPESYTSNQTWQWFLSPNSGTDCRLGGDGVLPTSKQFFLDSRVRGYIANALKYSSFVQGGFDRENDERLLAFEPFNEYLWNAGFTQANFKLFHDDYPDGTEYEVTTQPPNGTVTIDGDGNFVYTPDAGTGSDEGFTGSDYFYYRWRVPGGDWTAPKRSCGYVSPYDIPTTQNVLFYNEELTVAFQRDDCNVGYHGSDVDYTVPALKYSSPYSQEDADQQAEDDVSQNGQNYANDPDNGGTCDLNSPDAFVFNDLTGLELSTLTTSNTIVVPSNYPNYLMNIVSGEFNVNGTGWSSTPVTVNAGDTVQLRRTSSPDYLTTIDVQLQIGGTSDTWSITTKDETDSFGNVEMSQDFQRNNCPSGSTGTYVTYTVPADTFFAATQEDADALAEADIAANGQDFANDPENGSCLVDSTFAILAIDMYFDTTLDVCAYIDTAGVSQSNNIVSAIGALNFYLPSETVPTAFNAFMLSSDNIGGPTLTRRFEWNIGKLIGLYPDATTIPTFKLQVRGRSTVAGVKQGVYQLKFPTQQMIMTGSPGTYIPSITPAGGPASIPWTSNVLSGADNTVGTAVGALILTFTYTRATNTVSLTTY